MSRHRQRKTGSFRHWRPHTSICGSAVEAQALGSERKAATSRRTPKWRKRSVCVAEGVKISYFHCHSGISTFPERLRRLSCGASDSRAARVLRSGRLCRCHGITKDEQTWKGQNRNANPKRAMIWTSATKTTSRIALS